MLYLKQSTASQPIMIGPFVDDTDGATSETGLTIANTDIRLSKNGGNMAAKNSGGGTHDENGYYQITLDATDTDTVGRLQISIKVTGALAVWKEAQVLEEDIYDALFGASAAGFDSNARVAVGDMASGVIDSDSIAASALDGKGDWALASVLGAVADAAAAGDPTATDTAVAYLKQIVNTLVGSDGVGTFPAEAAPANAVSFAEVLRAIHADVTGLNGAAMRGTDNAMPATENGSSFTNIPWNSAWDSEVQSEVNDAMVAIHLDHFFSVTYDPASKPGAADALMNEIIENDGGVSRFTANSLEQAPSGGGGGGDATLANQTIMITHLTDIKGTGFVKDTNSLTNLSSGSAVNVTTEATNITSEND
tara:strand:+ start:10094 stop:11188 length:1095 start_codon:yes stop_codon:yes gene_type:complete